MDSILREVGIDCRLAQPLVCLRNVRIMVDVVDVSSLRDKLGVTNKAGAGRNRSVSPAVTRSLGGGDRDHPFFLEEVDRILDVVRPTVDENLRATVCTNNR